MNCWGFYTTLEAMKEKTQDTLNNCSTTSPLCLRTNQNDSEIFCPCVRGCLAWTLKESHIWSKISHVSDTKTCQSGISKPKEERARPTPLLTGVCHFKAVANVHNVDLGKELRGFRELRQRKPKSRMFLGLLIRK